MNELYEHDIVFGKMPDPLIFENGTSVRNEEDWIRRREEILKKDFVMAYGEMPPEPEVFSFVLAEKDFQSETYAIKAGTYEKQYCFDAKIIFPSWFDKNSGVKMPVLICGDDCWHDRYWNDEAADAVTDRGYVLVLFDRTAISADSPEDYDKTGIFTVYDNLKCTALTAWADGYRRVIDMLYDFSWTDRDYICVTGHSRGGKTVLIAAAADERIKFVNPNGSGSHGCGSWKYKTVVNPDAEYPGYAADHSEELGYMIKMFPHWMAEGIREYEGREADLPYDQHFFESLVAPRYLFDTEGFADIWANPRGTVQTYRAAKRVYEFLGAGDRMGIHFRDGNHFHRISDRMLFLDLVDAVRENRQIPEGLFGSYYPDMPDNFDR